MRPLFLAAETPLPARCLAVDCARADAAALYSHWPGHPAPPEIIADTSTAILLRAALQPQRWLAAFDCVANDHLDVDGVLAMLCACHPAWAKRHGPLLVGAAACGDFMGWPGAAAAGLAFSLHEQVAAMPVGGEQDFLDRLHADPDALISAAATPSKRVQAQIEAILQLRHALMGKTLGAPLSLAQQGGLSLIHGHYRHGHPAQGPTSVGVQDDCPPWALDGLLPAADFRLLVLEQGPGRLVWLEAPPHSWAHTVQLPQVPWPDLSETLALLQDHEPGPGRWLAGEAARHFGFTCLALCVEAAAPQASQIPLADLIAIFKPACAA